MTGSTITTGTGTKTSTDPESAVFGPDRNGTELTGFPVVVLGVRFGRSGPPARVGVA